MGNPSIKRIGLALLGHPFNLENPSIKMPQRNRAGYFNLHRFFQIAPSKLLCNFFNPASFQITSKLAFVITQA
jgi:hypothetical protein